MGNPVIYALTQDATIIQVGDLPSLWWDGTRWRDFREPDPAILAALVWLGRYLTS